MFFEVDLSLATLKSYPNLISARVLFFFPLGLNEMNDSQNLEYGVDYRERKHGKTISMIFDNRNLSSFELWLSYKNV